MSRFSSDAPSGGRTEEPWSRNSRPEPQEGGAPRRDYPPRTEGGGYRGGESGGFRGGEGGGFRGGRGGPRDAPVDDVDDKWSKAFGKSSSRGPAPDAPPSGGRGGFGGDRGGGWGGRDAPREGSRYGGPREGGERREGGFGGERREGGFGGERREGGFGGERREGGFGGERREGGGFGGERREGGGFGGERREPREGGFGGAREGGYGGAREGGFGGAREGGERRYAPRSRRDDDEVIDDPRFAGKFGNSGRGGGDRGDRGGDRGDRGGDRGGRFQRGEREDPSRYSGPLPTAPRGSLSATDKPVEVDPGLFGAMRIVEKKEKVEKKEVKPVVETKKAKDTSAKEEAEAKKQAEIEAEAAFKSAVAEIISFDARGSALTTQVQAKGAQYPAAVMTAVLESVEDVANSNWHETNQFGHVLKAFGKKVQDQAMLVFGVQQYCADKKFPKISVKGKDKKLIEILFNLLLKAELVDVEGFIAWADDFADRQYSGRTDAIVQTTGIIAQLRELMNEGDEEEEIDEEEIDAPRIYTGK